MNLEQLRSFEAVARLSHFTRAAAELFIAQPSLSRQIRALEADVGVALFERDRTQVRITEAGEALLPIARRMLADAAEAREQLAARAGASRGRVRLGAPPTLCVSVVAEVLADFTAQHPGVEIIITEAGSHALMDALAEGALDLALTISRPNVREHAHVHSRALFAEQLVVAHATQADVADVLTLAELAALPQVAFNRSYDLRVATDAAFAAAGLFPTIAVEGAEMDAVLRFVERGIGVAVVPATILLGRPGLRPSRLIDPSLTRTVNVSQRAGAGSSPAVVALRAGVADTVARMTAPGSAITQLVSPAP